MGDGLRLAVAILLGACTSAPAATSTTVATSAGLFAYHEGTGVASTLTVRTPDNLSSGWAGDEAGDWDQIETRRIAQVAAEKAAAWKGAAELEPGEYTCILEPTATGMLTS